MPPPLQVTKDPRVKGGAPAGVQCAMIVEGGAEKYAELFWYYGNEYDHFPSVDAVTLRMVCPDSTSTPVVSYYGDNPEIAALAELPVGEKDKAFAQCHEEWIKDFKQN